MNSSRASTLRIVFGIAIGCGGLLLALALAGLAGVALGSISDSVEAVGVMMLVVFAVILGLATAVALRMARARRVGRRAIGIAIVTSGALAIVIAALVMVPAQSSFVADEAPAQTEFWKLDTGSTLAVLHATPDSMPDERKAVIIVHGGPGTPGEGLPLGTDQLTAAGFDVFVYDQVGSGRSSRLSDVTEYTVARHVADLDALRERAGFSSVSLVGRSWGASLSAQYIAQFPRHVDAAIFVGPGRLWPGSAPSNGDPWSGLDPRAREAFDDRLFTPRMLVQNVLQGINPRLAHDFVGDAEADALLHDLAVIGKDAAVCPGATGGTPHRNPQGFYVNQLTNADFETVSDPRPSLEIFERPTLVLRGECDFVPASVAAEYLEVFVDSSLISVPKAGHAVAAEAPEQYVDALVEFLDDAAVSRGA